jgi:hypothetical protein
MKTFTEHELTLIRKLQTQQPQTTQQIYQSCPLHSVCTPLPVFRVYKIDDATFEAGWNDVHRPGTKQIFRFEDANQG